jgi:FkbM family methyltransferase
MTFVSHAQNLEDVMLWRCFGHLTNGFYIDVGAEDPISNSVTKSFYDRGWTGINIEPVTEAFAKLQAHRPKDVNIQVAISDSSGFIEFWHFPKTGLSTAVKQFADKNKSMGFEVNLISVETRQLKDLCEEYVTTPIHFMKIDVEGFEKQVLKSANFQKFRPMVVVVESTEPNTRIENYNEWEYILLENDYTFCYADGLNRFYLSEESNHLKIHFDYPPNVFDNYINISHFRNYESEWNYLKNESRRPINDNIDDSRFLKLIEARSSNEINNHEYKRILMTASCADSEDIPKVKDAGKTVEVDGRNLQVMHNGLKIVEGCYNGTWMTNLIRILKGHHEPQEELVFHKVLEHLHKHPSKWGNPIMIELGSFWSYYSMWFLKEFEEGMAFCIEPDTDNLKIGKENFLLNNLNGFFLQAQVSSEIAMHSEFRRTTNGEVIVVPSFNFTKIISSTGKSEIDLVLVDIQGAEIPLLENLPEVLKLYRIRFMVISTHDLEITGSPMTHQSALNLLIQNGAHIILEHSVAESYSGDGLILASFEEEDKSLEIPISYNRSKNSLFGEWEPRLEALINKYEQELEAITQSRTWRLLKPYRLLRKHF